MSKRHSLDYYDYWDIIEAALTCVPDKHPLRAQGLAAFDHVKERVIEARALVAESAAEPTEPPSGKPR